MEYIIGVLVSGIVQVFKLNYKTSGYETIFIAFTLSFMAAAFVVFFGGTEMFESLRNILITSGAFYAFVIRQFEN